MTRLSINQMTTFRWSFDEDLVNYARAGISALGIWRQKLADYGEERGIELVRESGLAVSNLLWAGGFTGGDVRTFRESVEDGLEAIRLAAQLKAGCLVVYTGARAGHTHNHARRLLRDALGELVPAATAAGVTLALEPMHPQCAGDWTFLTSLPETTALLDNFALDGLKLVFDTYHFGSHPETLNGLAALAPRIAVVHLADSKEPPNREQNRCRLGEGQIPLAELVAALQAGGYDGDYDLELLGEDIEDSDYLALIEHSRQAFGRLCSAAVG